MDQIKERVAASRDYIVDLRRHFRMHPEIGGQEIRTQEKIMSELTALGLSPVVAAGTGVLVEIGNGSAGKTVALRADMDALPFEDEIGEDYRSRRSGACHACGHDGHMAMLIGAARALAAMRAELPGRVRLVFQPSEERFPGGAQAMVAAGAMDGVAAVAGAHLWQPLAAGLVGVNAGPQMAAPDEFVITVRGKGGHGSMPDLTIDPILAGAQLVVALRTITGAHVDPRDAVVLTIGMFKAGEVFNVIPETAVLKGTVRTFDEATRKSIFANIESCCRGICAASGATHSLDSILGYPAVVNDPAVVPAIEAAAREAFGPAAVQAIRPVMGGEDFSFYQQKVPGAFFFIGAGNAKKGAEYPHHHPKFNIDEDVLTPGAETLVRVALNLLNRR